MRKSQKWSGRQFDPEVVKVFLEMPDNIWEDLRREIHAPDLSGGIFRRGQGLDSLGTVLQPDINPRTGHQPGPATSQESATPVNSLTRQCNPYHLARLATLER